MAEERLIDDDKDRKYKIRKNADGEDELVIVDEPEEEERAEEVEFEVPELLEDDEEAAVMTPEQLAARDRAREEAEQKRLKKLEERLALAKELIAAEKYDDCVFVIDEARELAPESGEIYALKLIALTRNFTDLSSRIDEGLPAAEGFANYFGAEVRENYAEIFERAGELKEPLKARVEALNAENEEAKSVRRAEFKSRRKKAGIALASCGVPFVIFAVLAIYFSTVMHARLDGLFMILFFVFLGLAVVGLIATLVCAHKFWDSSKLVSLNENNSSSKLGREYEEKNAELKLVEKVLSALKAEETVESAAENV